MTGSRISFNDSVGMGFAQDLHGGFQMFRRFFRRFSRPNGFHGSANLIFFRRVTGGAALRAADIFNRRLDDRHGPSKVKFNFLKKWRLMVNEPENTVNNG